jgi:MerR family transcriptional regulator, copper efflux regulator
LEVFNINESQERVQIIEKMLTYKKNLENSYEDFVDELINYYRKNNSPDNIKAADDPKRGLKDLKDISYENPFEAYLITQIKLVEELPPVIDEHIIMLNVGDDIDSVLESFESNVYLIKKRIYSNLGEWKVLLDHIDDERISEITCNPKGYGDLLLKELLWIRKCEEKQQKITE